MSGRLRVIMGPTASGKSALAMQWAEEYDGEIVSVDSMQLYRALPIGTAQPTAAERQRVRHHLVGILELHERAEVFRFCEMADAAVRDIWSRNKCAILCGGTGLYLKAFLYGLDDMPADRELRRKLDAEFDHSEGEAALHAKMQEVDPAAWERWKTCRRRLIRALEVYLITGKSILALQSGRKPAMRYDAGVWQLAPEAEELKQKISRRAAAMLSGGWIEEAQSAIAAGLFDTPTAHQALGYRQIGEFLAGRLDRKSLLEKICTATWQYARRQRTWFRHQHPEAKVLNIAGN